MKAFWNRICLRISILLLDSVTGLDFVGDRGRFEMQRDACKTKLRGS